MGYNLTNEFINQTFEQLTQISSSVLLDGTGSAITSLDVTASNAVHSNTATTASLALTASYVQGTIDSASYLYGNAENVGHVDFVLSTEPAAERRLTWNDADGTLNLGLKGGAVSLQVGQEEVVRVVNGTGGDLLEANYKVVKVIGAQGQRLQVDTALADSDINSATAIGLVTETILNNQEGFITTQGIVRGINTTGALQGETWNDGDVLYLSGTTPGGITNVKPDSPTHLIVLGYVVYAHANNGKIYVKVDNGYEIEELHDVLITSASDGQVLLQSGGLWVNADAVPSASRLDGTANVTEFSATGSFGVLQTAPGDGSSKDWFTITGAQAGGRAYDSWRVGINDAGGTEGRFQDAFRVGIFDSDAANFGSQFNVSGEGITLFAQASGSGGNFTSVKVEDQGDGTTKFEMLSEDIAALSFGNVGFDALGTLNFGTTYSNDIQLGKNGGVVTVNSDLHATSISASSATFTSASIGYLTSVTGSVKTIGDAFVVVNSDLPTQRYAGLSVYDSGSAQTTGSLYFDGELNDWNYEYTNGAPTYAVAMFGPEYSTKGSPVYPTTNRLVKGNGHHIEDSNISDDGSLVAISSATEITGSVGVLGDVDAQGRVRSVVTAPSASEDINFTTVNGAQVGATTYDLFRVGLIDQPAYGNRYEDAWQVWVADSPAENRGTSLAVNGVGISQYVKPNGGSTYNVFRLYDKGDGTGEIYGLAQRFEFLSYGDMQIDNLGATNIGTIYSSDINIGSTSTTTQINGQLEITGSVAGQVNVVGVSSQTGSLDFSGANMFTLDLPSGDTFITATNIKPGETVNLRLIQNGLGDGTVSFDPTVFRWQGGTAPTATATANHTDIISFVTFDNSNVYGSAVLDFS